MNYLDKIKKMTKDFISLKVEKEIDKVKIEIENAARNGEYEYRRSSSSFTYLNEVMVYFKKEGFQVKLENRYVENYSFMPHKDKYLIISWKE